jgi:hypothetical protein
MTLNTTCTHLQKAVFSSKRIFNNITLKYQKISHEDERKHIRAKIVVNGIILAQVTDFKYLEWISSIEVNKCRMSHITWNLL